MPLFDFLLRPPREGLVEYNFTLIREAPPLLAAAIGSLLVLSGLPVFLAAWRCGLDFKQAGVYPVLALSNVMVVAASLVGLDASALLYAVLIAYCFALATVGSALATGAREVYRGFLSAAALGIGFALAVMIADGNYSFGRLMGRTGPNYWGMNALAAFFAAFALRSVLLKAAVMLLALAAIYLCQSRGAMVAAGVGAGVVGLLIFYHTDSLRRLILVGGTTVVAVLALILFSDLIATKLLLLESRGRGLGSGGTGRFAAWTEAFDLFANSPWLGVGYRQHERYMTAASSSHNAYLASLAETGIFGFMVYLGLMAGGCAMAVYRAIQVPDRVRLAVAGLTAAFLAIGFVERVGMTTGNALSLVMIYASASAFRVEPRALAAARAGRRGQLVSDAA